MSSNPVTQKMYADANRDRDREANKRWRERNPERHKAIMDKARKKWAESNPEKVKEVNRNSARRHRAKKKAAEYQREWVKAHPEMAVSHVMKARYGLALSEYDILLAKQNSVCAICKQPEQLTRPGKSTYRLAIDHCHKTKTIRGLLCSNCNQGLGKFRDNPELLKQARLYLLSFPLPTS